MVDHGHERPHLPEVEIHPRRMPQPLVVVASQKLLDTRGADVVS
jgi:hypothetical protein